MDADYAAYLHRAADPAGRQGWVNAFLHGASEDEVAVGFLTSAEYAAAHETNPAFVRGLYADVLGRAPDARGEAGWLLELERGASRQAVALGFLDSTEAHLRAVDEYYSDFLGRDGEAFGRDSWLGQLQSHRLSLAQVGQAFLASDEYFNRNGLDGP